MKILNLYAGIGGNRKLWGNDHEITAVENVKEIADIYQEFFPNDKVILADVHQYLLDHFKEFDFIWSSPPCPTHSKMRFLQKKIVYPDMQLYQEIIVLNQWFKKKWVVENVMSYYKPLIKPFELHRHYIWSNFQIAEKEFPKMKTCKIKNEVGFLQDKLGFDIHNYGFKDKRKLLRNCVLPEIGLHIFQEAFREQNKLI